MIHLVTLRNAPNFTLLRSNLGQEIRTPGVLLFFREGLRSLPGPLLARVSGLYRLSLVFDGHAPERYRELHQKYGNIVRTGPNHVSISDASMIPTIYGIGSKFLKVGSRLST